MDSSSRAHELRLFISSTFIDLQEEREHLVKKIFPEIRSLCRERGITFTEVDLRWGITDDDVALGRIISTCLEEIDKCRPYFIGITGDRYGYVPELADYYANPEVLARWPWLEEAALDGPSIIDLEFRHGALNDIPAADGSVRFFFRRQLERFDDAGDSGEDRNRLELLKQRVRASGLPVEEYRDSRRLGEQVYDYLIEIIRRDFANAKPHTPLEQERSRHEAFAASRRRAYIPNPEYLKHLNDWLAGQGEPLVLYAESGSGKSSLISFWCDTLRRRQPDLFIVEHYVGIGAGDTDHLGIIRHVMQEIGERFGRSERLPTTPEALERDFANWLGFSVGQPMLLVIDGINQLSGQALNLHWLPLLMPAGVRLLISTTVEGTLVYLRSRGWKQLGMQPLKERERQAIVVRFLGEYRKALLPEQIAMLAEDAKCAHPLFLRTLLEELRLHGNHEYLNQALQNLLESTGAEDLFQRVLERLENDFSPKIVRDVMTLIWGSQSGLTEEELAALSGVGRLTLSTLLLGLDYHLVRRDGLLTFFHDYLRRAVRNRYLSDPERQRAVHMRLAAHFDEIIDLAASRGDRLPRREALLLLYQISCTGERRRLAGTLSNIPLFLALYDGQTQYDILGYWAGLHGEEDLQEHYLNALQAWRSVGRERGEIMSALNRVAELFTTVSRWKGAMELQRELLEMAVQENDTMVEAGARTGVGRLYLMLGDPEKAVAELMIACELYRTMEDKKGLAGAIGNLGVVYGSGGVYDQALECFSEQEKICHDLGDRRGISGVSGNMGALYYSQGEYALALECLGRQEMICRELGDRRGISGAVGNRGVILCSRGEYDQALKCFSEQEAIDSELGDRSGLCGAVGNRGNVHLYRGETLLALECYARQETLCRELGNLGSLSGAIGNTGLVYLDRREIDRAMECFSEQERIARELNDHELLSLALGNMGLVFMRRGDLDRAMECFQQQEQITRERGDRRIQALAAGGLGQLYLRLEETDRAMECFGRQEEISRTLGDRRGLWLAVGNMGEVHASRGEYERALNCYKRAADEHRTIGCRPPLIEWLCGISRTLLDLVRQGGEIPYYLAEYLPSHLPEGSDAEWMMLALQAAATAAQECVEISREISGEDLNVAAGILEQIRELQAERGEVDRSDDPGG